MSREAHAHAAPTEDGPAESQVIRHALEAYLSQG